MSDTPETPTPAPEPPRKKTIVFCLPGRSFSNRFLLSWTQTLHDLWNSGKYTVLISNQYSSCVHFARAKCLGASVMRGPNQLPFDGQIPYDVAIWIDSDIVFTSEQVIDLIESTTIHSVVSGIYRMEDMKSFCAVESWDTQYYVKNGGCFQFLTEEKINEYKSATGLNYMPCAYAGLGFCAFRYGVLEDSRLKYPWFHSDVQVIKTNDPNVPELHDMASEDVALFRKLIDTGIIPHVMVRLDMRVGHEKSVVL
jgi:hypothetical protein